MPSNVEIFKERCEAHALLVRNGDEDLRDALDELQAAAEQLSAELGEDGVQQIIAEAFDNQTNNAPFDEKAFFALCDAARAAHVKAQQAANGSNDADAEIKRLAALNPVQYEQERKAAAEKLNIRASILDKLVAAERPDDDDKQGSAISFPEPEPWPEPVNGAELLSGIADAIRKHVVLADDARDTAALWVLHTYLPDRSLVSPRLAITSPTKRCGKTTLLDVLGRLVLKPLPTAHVTPAAIFRTIEAYRPTLLIDEADTFLRDDDELRGIINSGHRKGGSVLRTVGDDHEPRAFATYAACAIALIGRLPETLHDRAVQVGLERRLPSEKIASFRPDRAGDLDELARKAARWAKDHAEQIGDADPEMPVGVFNREADNWRPLLAIADVAGGKWSKRARDALEKAHTDDDDDSRLAMLLADIKAEFAARESDRLPSGALVAALVEIEGRPWAEYRRGKPMTQNQLARALKPLGIAPELTRNGTNVARGYLISQFGEAFARYLAPEGASKPLQRYKRDECSTSDEGGVQNASVPDRKFQTLRRPRLFLYAWRRTHRPSRQTSIASALRGGAGGFA